MTSSTITRLLSLPLLVALGAPSAPHAAPACPPAPDRISVEVRASVVLDAASGLYTYPYSVGSAVTSSQDVDAFSVDVIRPVTAIRAPAGWVGDALEVRPRVQWDAFAVTVEGDRSVTPGVPPSSVQIPPGGTATGFSFQSRRPPGVGAYHASGFVQIPTVSAPTAAEGELLAEELAEACSLLSRPLVDQGVTGQTIVPIEAQAIRIRVKSGERPSPVNPGAQGVIPVAILGTAAFDVRSVDAASVRLGIDQARAIDRGHREDADGDGRQDLVLRFPTQGTGLRCGDATLVLTGRTTSGVTISGFDTIVTPGCR